MAIGAAESAQQQALVTAFASTELSLEELWLRSFALGGTSGLVDVDAHLNLGLPLPAAERDLLATAVNERLDELKVPSRVPLSRPFGPLAALVEVLAGAHQAAPERLPDVVAAAGRMLGVGVALYLVDDDQRQLIPVFARNRQPLDVDASMAGRAFRTVQTVPSGATGERLPRLWVPLLDGLERLGVLEAELLDPQGLTDLELQRQLRCLATLVGHLLVVTAAFGDALDHLRRPRPRSPAAELIWQLLPPLSAGTGSLVLSGLVQPSDDVGGDAFDYSLSETTVSCAIFDATGHELGAGLLASAAFAAYRSARHAGLPLVEQASAIDQTIAQHFHDAFVTGVLAELDLRTGRLQYLIAGHPHPLVLRAGSVVKALERGRRTPFGLPTDEHDLAEEQLEPGDWLVLHTDGITEARDATGEEFGESRLVDFVERAAAADQPPPETARRLLHAVLAHQSGRLQDDATILLAQWIRSPISNSSSSSQQP